MYNFDEAWDVAPEVTVVEYSPEIDVNPAPKEEAEVAAGSAP